MESLESGGKIHSQGVKGVYKPSELYVAGWFYFFLFNQTALQALQLPGSPRVARRAHRREPAP